MLLYRHPGAGTTAGLEDRYRLPFEKRPRNGVAGLPHIMPKRRHSVASQHEPVPGQTDVPLDTLMNQSCSICLENFWDPACIIACPADVCSALMCSHCAIKQHGMGVRRNGARTTEVHTCFSCRNDRHQAGPNGAPVSDPTPPRQGIHIRALAR